MDSRTQLTTILSSGFTLVLALAVGTTASAEERPLFDTAPSALSSTSRPIFGAAPLAAAQASTATTQPNDHQFGAGVRLGGANFGIGGSVRYFFYAGPLGVQAEVSRHSLDFGTRDFSSVQFSPSVIYRFREYEFEAPLTLTPYGGIGLSFIHSNFDEDEDFFQDILEVDDTDVGFLLYGGVELFFDRVPNLGVSGELTFNSNDDIVGGGFGTELGGVAFTGAAHWYFW